MIILKTTYYIEKIVNHFDMLECCPVPTPMYGSVKLLPHKGSPNSQLFVLKDDWIFDLCYDFN